MTTDGRRDRTGEIPEQRDDDHECDGGWLDRDADQPRACLICRPKLSRRELERRAGIGRNDYR